MVESQAKILIVDDEADNIRILVLCHVETIG